MTWLADGLLPEGELISIAGVPAVGKSVLGLELAYSVSTGEPFLGRAVQQGATLYLAAEGAKSTRRRLARFPDRKALRIAVASSKTSSTGDPAPADAIDLLAPDATKKIVEAIDIAAKRLGKAITLVIVDALGSSTRGGDENSSRDMGSAMAALLGVVSAKPVTIVLFGHPAKGGGDHFRGHSGLLADVAAHLSISKTENVQTLTVQKQRDAEAGVSVSFRTAIVDGALRAVHFEGPVPQRLSKLAKKPAQALAALRELGDGPHSIEGEWRDAAYVAFGTDGGSGPIGRRSPPPGRPCVTMASPRRSTIPSLSCRGGTLREFLPNTPASTN